MSLNTFGAILTFAIDLEARMSAYFQAAGSADRAKDAEKRRAKLQRARQEYVLEITLEAIDGLDEANYALNLGDNTPAGQKAAAAVAARFYAEVSPRINVRDAQRILEKCGKEYVALSA